MLAFLQCYVHVTKFLRATQNSLQYLGLTFTRSFRIGQKWLTEWEIEKVPTTISHTAMVYSCKHLKYKTLRSNMSNIWATRILINRSLDTVSYFPFTVQWLQRKKEKENPFLSMLGYSRRVLSVCKRRFLQGLRQTEDQSYFFLPKYQLCISIFLFLFNLHPQILIRKSDNLENYRRWVWLKIDIYVEWRSGFFLFHENDYERWIWRKCKWHVSSRWWMGWKIFCQACLQILRLPHASSTNKCRKNCYLWNFRLNHHTGVWLVNECMSDACRRRFYAIYVHSVAFHSFV